MPPAQLRDLKKQAGLNAQETTYKTSDCSLIQVKKLGVPAQSSSACPVISDSIHHKLNCTYTGCDRAVWCSLAIDRGFLVDVFGRSATYRVSSGLLRLLGIWIAITLIIIAVRICRVVHCRAEIIGGASTLHSVHQRRHAIVPRASCWTITRVDAA